jgi:hypothetical protein
VSKKIILFLYPYVISDHTYYNYELDYLDKINNVKLITHDLSSIIHNKKFNSAWNCINKNNKKINKFRSLFSWFFFIYKIKDKKNVWVYNHVASDNFKSFIINLLIKLYGFSVIIYPSAQVAEIVSKKNIIFFLKKLKKHLFNIKYLLFNINLHLFSFINSFFYYKKLFILYVGKEKFLFKKNETKEIFFIKSQALDYSNYLTSKKNNNHLNKTVVYLDTSDPYFKDDFNLMNFKYPKNINSWYDSLNLFFLKLKNNFNLKTIILPHPKNKGRDNPYFNKKMITHDVNAAAELIPNCAAVISKGSTAISYAIITYKPIILIYSKWYLFHKTYLNNIFFQAKELGKKAIDIDKFKLDDINKNFHVNKKKYDQYKYKYLTSCDQNISNKPNYKIIKDLLLK